MEVTNSRPQKKSNQIWRRRHCLVCGAVFTTEEKIVTEQSIVVTHLATSEPFNRDKLLLSVYDSLRHRKTALGDATALVETIWSQLLPHITDASIDRQDIVSVTSGVLSRFDKAAATTYLAYHPLNK